MSQPDTTLASPPTTDVTSKSVPLMQSDMTKEPTELLRRRMLAFSTGA